ncbi:hypothetical protein ACNIRM_25150, partial [Escherichia coli]
MWEKNPTEKNKKPHPPPPQKKKKTTHKKKTPKTTEPRALGRRWAGNQFLLRIAWVGGVSAT